MNTVARLRSDGILYTNLFDEFSSPSRNVGVDQSGIFYSNTMKEGEFAGLPANTPMRIMSDKSLLVGNYFDELTGIDNVTAAVVMSAMLVLDLDASLYSGSGNWLDNSGYSNNASLVATPTYISGGGSYFNLDGLVTTGFGSNDSFLVNDAVTMDSMSDISFEMWINIDNVLGFGSPNMLFDKRLSTSNGYVGFFTDSGFTFRMGTSSASQFSYSTTPTTLSWLHLIVTVGSSGSRLYINNTEVASSVYTGNFSNINTSAGLVIGDLSISATGVHSFDGKIGLFRIYNGILTPSDVNNRWVATKHRFGL